MPPRNSRLSAYYNLPASPSPKSSPSRLPKTRDEALSQADNVTKTLPLADLLSYATTQKTRSETLSKQLHAATLSHYQHLQSALETAKKVQSLCKSHRPSTETVNEAISRSSAINQGLAETRSLVASLEASRKVEQLLQAAKILTKQFPELAEQLSLCTDPDKLRADIKLSSSRYAAIIPAISKMATVDQSLNITVESLEQSAKVLCEALTSEQTVLQRGEVASVRLTLQDDRASVENDFVRSVVDDVLHRRVSEKALSGTSIDKSVIQVNFFLDHVFGILMRDVEVYESLFGDCSWVSEVVHDALAEVREGISGVIDNVAGVCKLRESIAKLGDKGDVGQRAAESLEGIIRSIALSEASDRIKKLLGDVEDAEKAVLVEQVNELHEKLAQLLGWDQTKMERLLAKELTQPTSVREAATGAALCQVLITERWKLEKVQAACVELTVSAVMHQFRLGLKGPNDFIASVKCAESLGKRFRVSGLVDDDLGDGFGNRVFKGLVEIVREKGLSLEEAERVRAIVGEVDGFEMDTLDNTIEERLFE